MPGTGTLTVSAAAEDGFVAIGVSDTGGGMDPEALARAFEPYFSTKGTGTGLGLPIAKRNVELSGGTIAIDSPSRPRHHRDRAPARGADVRTGYRVGGVGRAGRRRSRVQARPMNADAR